MEESQKEREREEKLNLFQRFKTNYTLYVYIYMLIYIYICIHLKIAEHCLLTISYFSTSVFAYFLWPFHPAVSLGLRAVESNLYWNI